MRVCFPQDEAAKQRKLSRLWHGPYRVTQINDPDVTVVKVYFPEEGLLQVHQLRICQCPSGLPVGFYWYGKTWKSSGRVPQWAERIVEAGPHQVAMKTTPLMIYQHLKLQPSGPCTHQLFQEVGPILNTCTKSQDELCTGGSA